jgi:hypothetical protein
MDATTYGEIEIGLHRWNIDSYSAELRFSQDEGSNGASSASQIDTDIIDVRVLRGIQFDFDALQANALDPVSYGRALTASVFADPRLQTAFTVACTRAQERNQKLRLRLFIGPSAPELHGLRWETLRDPRSPDDSWLVSSEHIHFSRYLTTFGYLSGEGWQRVRLRPQSELSALVVIANPAGLEGSWNLAEIDVKTERERAEAGLAGLGLTVLASNGEATVDNLVDQLREGCDILYLVCHGALMKGEARLWLEDASGNVALVDASDLLARLRDLPQLPRLVVLASCQSAGKGTGPAADYEGEFQRALGPRLAEAGVPAVLAMHGDFTMASAAKFLAKFFEELQRDGQIDRAMATARGSVRDRPDHWMPVLFMRLRSGRLWYAPGFGATDKDFKGWPVVLASIRRGAVTPILGPGVVEALLGSRREIALRWAETYKFPLAFQDRDSLPEVAQYLAVDQAPVFPAQALEEYLHEELVHRYAAELPPEAASASLIELLSKAAALHRERNPADPHRVLAGLPLPLFITTHPGNALSDALKAEGKDPQVEICRWNSYTDILPSIYDDEPAYRPTAERPLVYHVFGHFDHLDSLVLTEDDFFDFLIGLTRRKDQVPKVVRSALATTALVFLGFHLEDWNFRVLFRSILSQEGGELRGRYPHVAVQVEMDEDRVMSPQKARDYLKEYFSKGASVSVYWGNSEDFAKELLERVSGDVK